MTSYTFVMIKPDATERNLVGEIIRDFERAGLAVTDLAVRRLAVSEAMYLYGEHREKGHFNDLVNYTCSGPVVLIELGCDRSDIDAVALARSTIGSSKIDRSEGTIRARWALDVRRNSVHGSDSKEAAERELNYFFPLGGE